MRLTRDFGCLILSGFLLLGCSAAMLPAAVQQTPSAAKAEPSPAAQRSATSLVTTGSVDPAVLPELPDSPGAIVANSHEPASKQGWSGAPPTGQNQTPQSASPRTAPPSTQDSQAPAPQKPVGTAAAEGSHASGVAASQPAGVAIAPAKQRRVRTIVLKVGAIVGAGVAVGSVVALTAATPSKPPGAR